MYSKENIKNIVKKANNVLINNLNTKYPVNIERICKEENIKLVEFEVAKKFIKIGDSKTFTIIKEEKIMIVYDSGLNSKWKRFLLAHELGHIKLEHFKKNIDYRIKEKEANLFAQILLGSFNCMQKNKTREEISEICDIPKEYAFIDEDIAKRLLRRNL